MTVHIWRGERFITAEAIAYQTGWHLMTVYRKAKNGEIPGAVKWGRTLRFRQSEIEGWLNGAAVSVSTSSDFITDAGKQHLNVNPTRQEVRDAHSVS